jgi:long-chain fatty acid transport protein
MRGRSLFAALFLGLLSLLIGVQPSFGAGFALYEGSARGNALGGGLVGRADDPSALFYNPAGITQVPGTQAQLGVTVILPDTDVKTRNSPFGDADDTTSTENNVWIPPHAYLTYQFSDKVWFGLATFSRFGLGTEFPEDWPGRFNNYNAVIETLSINPNIAFKLNDQFSFAVGMEVMYFDLELERKLPIPSPVLETDQSLNGDSFGYGFNLAMHYKPCKYAAFGVSYRSQVKQNVEGDADFHSPAPIFTDTDVEGSVVLPDEVFLGVAIYPTDRLSFEIGAIWTNWSTFDELKIKFDDPQIGFGGADEISVPKDWDDVWRINFSAEYKLLDWLDLRAGYVYDESPIPDHTVDYLVPANDRHMFAFGPGFHWDRWTVDLSYTYLLIEERDVDARPAPPDFVLDSKFENGHAHLIGATVGYKF